jgi:peptide/nickel transport system substrate-binding protein
VRALDFRRGIQRQLTSGVAFAYYRGILGAQMCQPPPGRCDLSAGIVTNDAAGTVTLHLRQADPDFLDKLALLLATPARPALPTTSSTAPFLPGTGPYMIASYRPKRSLTLQRNPCFRQYSYAAQPTGYPGVIRFEQMADPGRQLAAVAAGRADLVDISWNGQSYASLAIRYPARVDGGYPVFSVYVFLNTHRPPFSNVKARQAVS